MHRVRISAKLRSVTLCERFAPRRRVHRTQIGFRHQCRSLLGDDGLDHEEFKTTQNLDAEWIPDSVDEKEVFELTPEEQAMIDKDYIPDPDAFEDDSILAELLSDDHEGPLIVEGPNGEEIAIDEESDDQFYADRQQYEDLEELEKSKQFAIAMAFVADEMKCTNIRVLDVHTRRDWTEYFLILSAMSSTQLKAVLGKIEKVAREEWDMEVHQAITRKSEWECIDFGTVIIHAFSPRAREYYKLEKLYEKCEEV
eukprot:g8261.t1